MNINKGDMVRFTKEAQAAINTVADNKTYEVLKVEVRPIGRLITLKNKRPEINEKWLEVI